MMDNDSQNDCDSPAPSHHHHKRETPCVHMTTDTIKKQQKKQQFNLTVKIT